MDGADEPLPKLCRSNRRYLRLESKPSMVIESALACSWLLVSGGRKMPVTYQINRESGLIETRCTGEVTFDEVMGHFEQLEAEPSLPGRLDVLLDLEGTTTLPESGQLLEVARAVDRLKAKVQWGACAIVASRDALFGMIRMFEVFVEGMFVRTRVFRERKEAERWLSSIHSPVG